MQSQIQELVCYIWDNYLQISESAQSIFLLGVGNAYLGVKVLLVNRGMYLRPNPTSYFPIFDVSF
jgi:histone deacetylase 6